MTAPLTENEFSQHINTKFRLNVDTPEPIELELVEVEPYEHKNKPGEQDGLERFSIYFNGPADVFLQQAMYPLKHDQMGEFEVFLVPIARNETGFRYEAVFNYKI